MNLLLDGVGTENKGAELMLRAIQNQFSGDDVRFVVDPLFGSYEDRARYSLRSLLPMKRGLRGDLVARLMSPAFRSSYGLVDETEIGGVLDAAGYAYGDRWGTEPTENLERRTRKWAKRKVPFVLLPQAFGPFTSDGIRRAFRRVLDQVALVFARDTISLQHIEDLGGPFQHVHLAPDFTHVVQAEEPTGIELPDRFVALVPNQQMLDKSEGRVRESYVPFLTKCIGYLEARQIDIVILSHSSKFDKSLAVELQSKGRQSIPLITEECPARMKGILGKADLVIGSRYHALVSALSQAVPCIATSWSHKYETLFSDYGIPDLVIGTNVDQATIEHAFETVLEGSSRVPLVTRLHEYGQTLHKKSDYTFDMSRSAFGLPPVQHPSVPSELVNSH